MTDLIKKQIESIKLDAIDNKTESLDGTPLVYIEQINFELLCNMALKYLDMKEIK